MTARLDAAYTVETTYPVRDGSDNGYAQSTVRAKAIAHAKTYAKAHEDARGHHVRDVAHAGRTERLGGAQVQVHRREGESVMTTALLLFYGACLFCVVVAVGLVAVAIRRAPQRKPRS